MQRKIKLAARVKTPEDPIDVIFNKVLLLDKERKLKGLESIISLGMGQPHLGTHPYIVNKLRESLSTSFPYEDLQGSPETVEAICKLYKQYYPLANYSSAEVMITNGATQAIHNALGALIDRNDEVLVVEPYYSAYSSIIKDMGGELVKVETAENNFRLSAKQLSTTLQQHPHAKVIILNYPNNPSGIDLSPQELKELAATLNNYPDLFILVDDVYRDLVTNEHHTLLDIDPALKDRCIMIYSASKGFALPGARIGMAGAPAEIIHAMKMQQAKSTSSISTLTESGLMAAVDFKFNAAPEFANWIDSCKTAYTQNMQRVSSYLASLGFRVVPGGHGFFVLASANFMINQPIPDAIEYPSATGEIVRVDDLHQKIGTMFRNDNDLILYFLHTTGVALIPGSAFGIDEQMGFMRISCAKEPGELQLALCRIKEALNALPGLTNCPAKFFTSTPVGEITPIQPTRRFSNGQN